VGGWVGCGWGGGRVGRVLGCGERATIGAVLRLEVQGSSKFVSGLGVRIYMWG